jgi:hypothetical protein
MRTILGAATAPLVSQFFRLDISTLSRIVEGVARVVSHLHTEESLYTRQVLFF